MQVTVGAKYQIVIPKEVRKRIKDIRPGAKVRVEPGPNDSVTIKVTRRNWADISYGFMRDAWKGIDPTKEIEKMRGEWDKKF